MATADKSEKAETPDASKSTQIRVGPKLLKRIDIGLVTGLLALLVSALALFNAFNQFRSYQRTQKAAVLPIIELEYGFDEEQKPYNYHVRLRNTGRGIAYVHRLTPLMDDAPAEDYRVWLDRQMNGRLHLGGLMAIEAGTGYLSPGMERTPLYINWGNSLQAQGDIYAVMRGTFETQPETISIEACFCSVFDDCWTVVANSRKRPTPVDSCGTGDPEDGFAAFAALRQQRRVEAAAR